MTGKIYPTTDHKGPVRKYMYLYISLTSALDEGGGGHKIFLSCASYVAYIMPEKFKLQFDLSPSIRSSRSDVFNTVSELHSSHCVPRKAQVFLQ
jgi:hypothetical protein